MLRQLYNDASDSAPIENNRVTPDRVATHFQVTPLCSMRTVFTQTLGVNGPLAITNAFAVPLHRVQSLML